MTVLPVFIVVFFTVGELFHPSFTSSGKPAVSEVTNAIPKSFAIEKTFVNFAVGTLATVLLEKLLYLDGDNRAQCALSIHNSLTSYRLVNPVLLSFTVEIRYHHH